MLWHVYWNGVTGRGAEWTVAQQPSGGFRISVFSAAGTPAGFTACQTDMAKRRMNRPG
jgi:hypothetical protein